MAASDLDPQLEPKLRPADHFRQRFAGAAAFCREHADAADRAGIFPQVEFELLARAGALAAPLPRAQGGLGLGSEPGRSGELLDLLQILGGASLPVARLFEGHVNALQLIHLFGNDEQRARHGEEARVRALRFAVWNTDAEDTLRLEPERGCWRLAGAKTLASGAGAIERPLVTARMSDGRPQMCVVAADEVACSIDRDVWQVSGMRASASYRISFDGLRLRPEALIGEPGDYHRQPWFSGGAVRFAAAQFGAACALFEHCRHHLQQSGRGGDPHQRVRLGQMAIALETGALWLDRAGQWADRALRPATEANGAAVAETIVAHANMTRSVILRICLDVLELAERSIGLKGLLQPHPVERIGRDLRLYLRQPAPDAALVEAGRFALERGRFATAAP